jgi:hypothetical protein
MYDFVKESARDVISHFWWEAAVSTAVKAVDTPSFVGRELLLP